MVRRPDDRIPVEPLSEARWARIERSLEERLQEDAGGFGEPAPPIPRWRSPRVLWLAGVATIAAGVFLARTSFRTVAPSAGSHIETGEAASHLMVGGASILVAPRTEATVSGDEDRGVLVVLDNGEVDCEVAPRHERPPFIVQAGDVRVRVVGTRFAVKREGSDVSVDVARGVVEVDARGETDRVTAGSHWPVEAQSSPDEESPARPPAAGVAPVEATSPSGPVARTPGARRAASPAANRDSIPPVADVARPTTTPPLPSPTTPEEVRSTAAGAADTQTAQQRYETAARMEARDPVSALSLYRQLAHDGSDAWSANALYAAGRLQADRGASVEARALLQEYLARFPHGLNAPDAHDLLRRLVHATP